MAINKKAVRTVLDRAIKAKRSVLSAAECKKICSAYDIPLPRDGMAASTDKAAALAKRLGFPVVMKIVSEDILHKTDAGGVVVGVDSASAAKKAYTEIVKNARKYNKNAKIDGVQVQKMLPSDGAQEVLIGAVTDPSFGKLVAFGLGGIPGRGDEGHHLPSRPGEPQRCAVHARRYRRRRNAEGRARVRPGRPARPWRS